MDSVFRHLVGMFSRLTLQRSHVHGIPTQRQPGNPRRQLQQRRFLCAITRPKNEHTRAVDRFVAQGRGGSRRPRHWSCRRGRSAHAACKHAVRVPVATRTATPSTCAQIHLRRVWPNAHGAVLFPPCTPEHYARQLHGSGHTRPLASAKTSRKPTPACMHKHGKSARVRWPRVPIGGVCAHTAERATWGVARQV